MRLRHEVERRNPHTIEIQPLPVPLAPAEVEPNPLITNRQERESQHPSGATGACWNIFPRICDHAVVTPIAEATHADAQLVQFPVLVLGCERVRQCKRGMLPAMLQKACKKQIIDRSKPLWCVLRFVVLILYYCPILLKCWLLLIWCDCSKIL